LNNNFFGIGETV